MVSAERWLRTAVTRTPLPTSGKRGGADLRDDAPSGVASVDPAHGCSLRTAGQRVSGTPQKIQKTGCTCDSLTSPKVYFGTELSEEQPVYVDLPPGDPGHGRGLRGCLRVRRRRPLRRSSATSPPLAPSARPWPRPRCSRRGLQPGAAGLWPIVARGHRLSRPRVARVARSDSCASISCWSSLQLGSFCVRRTASSRRPVRP